jgi:ABC-type multidrug transport system fused ATPase/permease subunit
MGNHEELININGYYKETYNEQLISKELSE